MHVCSCLICKTWSNRSGLGPGRKHHVWGQWPHPQHTQEQGNDLGLLEETSFSTASLYQRGWGAKGRQGRKGRFLELTEHHSHSEESPEKAPLHQVAGDSWLEPSPTHLHLQRTDRGHPHRWHQCYRNTTQAERESLLRVMNTPERIAGKKTVFNRQHVCGALQEKRRGDDERVSPPRSVSAQDRNAAHRKWEPAERQRPDQEEDWLFYQLLLGHSWTEDKPKPRPN